MRASEGVDPDCAKADRGGQFDGLDLCDYEPVVRLFDRGGGHGFAGRLSCSGNVIRHRSRLRRHRLRVWRKEIVRARPALLKQPRLEQQQPSRHNDKDNQAQIVGRKLCFAVFHHLSPSKERSFTNTRVRDRRKVSKNPRSANRQKPDRKGGLVRQA